MRVLRVPPRGDLVIQSQASFRSTPARALSLSAHHFSLSLALLGSPLSPRYAGLEDRRNDQGPAIAAEITQYLLGGGRETKGATLTNMIKMM